MDSRSYLKHIDAWRTRHDIVPIKQQCILACGPFLLIWFNVNASMDK